MSNLRKTRCVPTRSRVPSQCAKCFPLKNALFDVELEDAYGDLTNLRPRPDGRALALEMLLPLVDARIVEPDELTRTLRDQAQVGSLVSIAWKARVCEILRASCSTVLDGDDMVHLATEVRVRIGDEAILTSPRGPLSNPAPQLGADRANPATNAVVLVPWPSSSGARAGRNARARISLGT